MKVSIVMPTYNSERFISEALYCIKNQSHGNVELIIVDGGSSDSTIELITSFDIKNVRIISEADSGIADALNKGFKLASGDILCWQNSDDVIFSAQCLENVSRHFKTSKCDFLIGKSALLNEDGLVFKTLYPYLPDKDSYCGGCNLFTGSLFFTRKMWEAFGGFSINYKVAFEYEILQKLINTGKGAVTKDLIGGLRIYPGTVSAKGKLVAKNEALEIFGMNYVELNAIRKLILQIKNGSLTNTIMNFISDEFSGKSWKSVYEQLSGISK